MKKLISPIKNNLFIVVLILFAFAAGALVQKYYSPDQKLKILLNYLSSLKANNSQDTATTAYSYNAPVDDNLIQEFGLPEGIYDSNSPYVYATDAEHRIPPRKKFSTYRYYPYYKQVEDYLRSPRAKQEARKLKAEFWKGSGVGVPLEKNEVEAKRKFLKKSLGVKDLPPSGRVRSRSRLVDKSAFSIDRLELESRNNAISFPVLLAKPHEEPVKGIVIALHGHSSSPEQVMGLNERDYTRKFGEKLVEEGYIVYAPYIYNVSRYNAQTNALGMLYSGETKYSLDINKLESVVDLIRGNPSTAKLPVILWGISYGGRLSTLFAAVEERIDIVVINGGFKHHRKFLEDNFQYDNRAYWLEHAMFNRPLYIYFDPDDVFKLIFPRPVILELPAYDLGPFPLTIVTIWRNIECLYARNQLDNRTKLIWFRGYHETAPDLTIPELNSVVADRRQVPANIKTAQTFQSQVQNDSDKCPDS